MNVLWLYSDRAGCGVYRAYAPALTLQERGYDNHFVLHAEMPRKGFEGLEDIHIAVFQRAVGTIFRDWIRECRRAGIASIFEMDDDLFHVSRNNPAGNFWNDKKIKRLLAEQLGMVDRVIVSTEPLREAVAKATGRTDIAVCPNHLHPTMWSAANFLGQPRTPNLFEGKKITVIGWQGSNTHDRDFQEAIPALVRILNERPDVILRFFGNVPLSCRGHIPESRLQWARGVEFHLYPQTLHFMNFDIGLAPIVNSKFNQAKSNLKWLEYSALGVPCVASRVYPYETSIEHGRTGFVAGTPDEWYDALTTLLENRDQRHAVGRAAQQHVTDAWGTKRAEAWRRVFVELRGEPDGQQHPPAPRLFGTAGVPQPLETL